MSEKRIMCVGSEVYHKNGCYYAKRIRPLMRRQVKKAEAISNGCRACKYCNSINFHMKFDRKVMEDYKKNKGMEFTTVNGNLYVKTSVSCWRLEYVKSNEKIYLYHINYMPENFDFTHPNTCRYHFQKDAKMSDSVAHYFNYIYEHDLYKAAVKNGEKLTQFHSKRARELAVRSDRKRARRGLENAFKILEMQRPEYKKLSYC